jgi:fatty-acyl-CoA synthase
MASLLGSSRDEISGHALPLFHVGGLVTICLRSLIYGQTLVTLTTAGYRNPDVIANFWKIANSYSLTNVVVTPTTAAAILNNGEIPPPDHKLKKFFCGGATVPLELAQGFYRKFGVWLREFWGMSELYGCVTGQPDDGNPAISGSVGHVLPFHELKIVEVDDSGRYVRDCAPKERGVIAVSGVAVVPGYAQKELDKELFFSGMGDDKNWINTGDLGIVDDNGFLWIYGRSKDVIIRGGHNIDPAMIEEILASHPQVQLSAAIGRPDKFKGELPMAYVQLKTGGDITPEDLISYCQTHMQERAAIPVEIVLIDQMPLTPVGKVFKPALRIDAMKLVAKRVAESVISGAHTVDILVDESKRRPKIILCIPSAGEDLTTLIAKLNEAFKGFDFLTEIVAS